MKEISEQGEAVVIHCHKIEKAATSKPAEQVSALKEKSQSRMSLAGRMLLCGKNIDIDDSDLKNDLEHSDSERFISLTFSFPRGHPSDVG